MMSIRDYRSTDWDALYRVCVETGDSGGDATGHFRDDDLLPDVYTGPYLVHDPGLALVVDAAAAAGDAGDARESASAGRAIGYIIGTMDTVVFDRWFAGEWWPRVAAKHPLDGASGREAEIIGDAAGRGAPLPELLAPYPAHLHIDLLPQAQGQGLGRQLIERFLVRLADRGVTGVHLGVGAANTGAHRFYERTGFTRLGGADGAIWFARTL